MLARTTRIATLFAALVAGVTGCGSSNPSGDNPDASGGDAHATPDAPQGDPSAVTAVPLTSLDEVGYTAQMRYGTQMFDVLIDTGSTSTGIASTACPSCGVSPEYTTTGATDVKQTAMSVYGQGQWTGEVFEDGATLGDRPAVALDFAAITTQKDFFQGDSFQGILGLGPDELLVKFTTSYLTQSEAAGMTAEVAFQLCPDGGTMWLGGFDPKATAAAPSFTPMLAGAPYYMIDVGGFSVDGTALPVTAADFGPTIIDTGTTASLVPTAVETALISAISSSAGYAQVFGTQTLADGACLNTTSSRADIDAMMPPLAVSFPGAGGVAGAAISIPATHAYLLNEGGPWCFTFSDSSALTGGSKQKISLLGNTLLAGMVTIVDTGNQQIGFAPQAGCAVDAPALAKKTNQHVLPPRPLRPL